MKALCFVWGLVAFSILGFTLSSETETFILQDFESNFRIVDHPEEFLPGWAANEVRNGTSRVFQAPGKGINGSRALGVQTIGSFDAQIYIKTSTKGLKSNIFSLYARTERNGSGNRPVIVTYDFSDAGQASLQELLAPAESFPNADTEYRLWEIPIPEPWRNREAVTLTLNVQYGPGTGTAARWYMDDFGIKVSEPSGPLPDDPEPKDPVEEVPTFPSLQRAETPDGHTLNLIFESPLPISLGMPLLSAGYGRPIAWEVTENQLSLQFSEYLFSNIYELTLSFPGTPEQVQQQVAFELQTPTPAGAVIIHEFMADPNPKGLLPSDLRLPTAANDEYIELHNRMDKPIRLKGFTYNDGPLEDITIPAQGFVVLVPMPRKGNFVQWEPVVGVSGFRSLPNGAGQIRIQDAFENIVDSLSYDTFWYGNPQKSQGGWSLERKNPYVNCSSSHNWTASESPSGGTPGMRNSVYTSEVDRRPFQILEVIPLNDTRIQVRLSKPLPTDGLSDLRAMLNGVTLELDSLSGNSLWLSSQDPFASGATYSLHFENLLDCFGMELEDSSASFVYDTDPPTILSISGKAGNELVLYLDEPLDGRSLPGSGTFRITPFQGEVVQLLQPRIDELRLILNEDLPQGFRYELETVGISDRFGNRMDTTRISFLWQDQVDTVHFHAPNTLRIRFKTDTDPASARNRENYLLNRNLGHPVVVMQNPEDELVFDLLFDRDFPANQAITVEIGPILDRQGTPIAAFRRSFTWDTRTIGLSSITPLRPNGLTLQFNKALDPKTLQIPANFTVSPSNENPTRIEILNPQTIRLTFSTHWEDDLSYQLRVRGLRDLYGNGLARELTSTFGLIGALPKIDTAFLASPFHLIVEVDRRLDSTASFGVNGNRLRTRMIGPTRFELVSDVALNALELRIELLLPEEQPVLYHLTNQNLQVYEVRLVDEKSIFLTFTDFLDPVTGLFPDSYLVNDGVVHEVELSEEGYGVLLRLVQPMTLNAPWKLELGSLQSVQGKSLQRRLHEGIYSDGISDSWVPTSQSAVLLHQTPLPTENSLRGILAFEDEEITVEAWVNRSQPRQLQLVFSSPLIPNRHYRLRIPPRIDQQGNWLSGSVRDIRWDNLPPTLQQVELIRDTELVLYFDEPLDPVFAMIPSFYDLEGIHPVEATVGPAPHQVVLTFSERPAAWDNDIALSISGLEDLHGNAIVEQVFIFSYDPPLPPAYRDIVINEIMPAPRADGPLPNVEYVELYNRSQRPIQIGGMQFGNNRAFTSLPRRLLDPGEYLLLCPATQVSQFSSFGEVIGISPWPTMLNSGDEIWIGTADGTLIDRLVYTHASFGSNSIAQGGYSLELVNPHYPCESPANIRPSESSLRGTPGKQNSVFDQTPDRTAPRLLGAYPVDANRLRLDFSKPITEVNLQAQFILYPPLTVSETTLDPMNSHTIWLTFSEPFRSNQRYEISVTNWADCAGNPLHSEASTSTFKVPGVPDAGDIVLNEILFNPPTGGPKFVEIYNASDKYIDLKNWKLANSTTGEIANRRIISGSSDILLPREFRVLTTDPDVLHQNYPQGNADTFRQMNLPSYPIRSGTVILLNPDETIQERYAYHERHHHPLLRDPRGVSLERISLSRLSDDPENWQSASATAGYATPGYRNSQVVSPNALERGIQVTPKVFIPEGAGEAPFTTISYKLDQPGFVATLRIYATNGQRVRELCQNQLWGQSGFYIWDGTDERGARVKSGYYVIWVELFHPDGQVYQIKKTVVVGTKL